VLHALRNACPESPHTLVSGRAGRFDGDIVCKLHGQRFSWNGHHAGGRGAVKLPSLELISRAGLLYARAPREEGSGSGPAPAIPPAGVAAELPVALTLLGEPTEMIVAADWKVVVEHWLTLADRQRVKPIADDLRAASIGWHSLPLRLGGWSERRYRKLLRCTVQYPWRFDFIAPHQLLESRPDGLSVVQAIPVGAARCRVRCTDFTVLSEGDAAYAVRFLAHRLGPYARRAARDVAESIQSGVVQFGYQAAADAVPASTVSWFRSWYEQSME
jgi:phenylpropionate dioxygenase-like ring-hydroxylating dioxygenase large terminal subunit